MDSFSLLFLLFLAFFWSKTGFLLSSHFRTIKITVVHSFSAVCVWWDMLDEDWLHLYSFLHDYNLLSGELPSSRANLQLILTAAFFLSTRLQYVTVWRWDILLPLSLGINTPFVLSLPLLFSAYLLAWMLPSSMQKKDMCCKRCWNFDGLKQRKSYCLIDS